MLVARTRRAGNVDPIVVNVRPCKPEIDDTVGSRGISSDLVRALNVTLDWLIAGAEERPSTLAPSTDLIYLPRYDVALSEGGGSFVERAPRLDSIPFPQDVFVRRLGQKPHGMIIVDATGDSMLPTVAERDLIMIDIADTQMTCAIWGFTYEDGVFIKRISVLPDSLRVLSDNPTYEPFTLERSHIDRLHPIGRVAWVGHTL